MKTLLSHECQLYTHTLISRVLCMHLLDYIEPLSTVCGRNWVSWHATWLIYSHTWLLPADLAWELPNSRSAISSSIRFTVLPIFSQQVAVKDLHSCVNTPAQPCRSWCYSLHFSLLEMAEVSLILFMQILTNFIYLSMRCNYLKVIRERNQWQMTWSHQSATENHLGLWFLSCKCKSKDDFHIQTWH